MLPTVIMKICFWPWRLHRSQSVPRPLLGGCLTCWAWPASTLVILNHILQKLLQQLTTVMRTIYLSIKFWSWPIGPNLREFTKCFMNDLLFKMFLIRYVFRWPNKTIEMSSLLKGKFTEFILYAKACIYWFLMTVTACESVFV